MLFLTMGFISLVDEILFMLISSRHICIRSIIPEKLNKTGDTVVNKAGEIQCEEGESQ